jgi:hypothetical protein
MSQYPTLDLSAFRESGYNPISPKIAILVADLWTPSTYIFKCLFFFRFMQGCFVVHNITSTHHNISLGQCQRQCMVSTYFGYKVCIHESSLRAPELTPRLVGGIGVVHLFSLSSVVCFCFFLSSVCVLCAQCCQFFWTVLLVFSTVYLLPKFFHVSYVPNVAIFSE